VLPPNHPPTEQLHTLLKPRLDFPALSWDQFLVPQQSPKTGLLPLGHGKLNLDGWISQAQLGLQSTL